MKKLLLIFITLILCSFSPRLFPVFAQKLNMSFDTSAAIHPTLKGQLNSDFTFNEDYTVEFPTTAPTNNNNKISAYTNTAYSGIKQYETDDIILSFDYSDCLFKNVKSNNENTGWKFTSILKSVTSTYLDVAIMPGTKFTISLKDSNKRIKKVNVYIPSTYKSRLNQAKFESNLTLSESDKDKFSMSLVDNAKVTPVSTQIPTKAISIESKGLFGENSPVTVCVKRENTQTVTAPSTTAITETMATTATTTIPSIQAFSIYHIEVEYIEGEAPEHTLNLTASANNVLHWNSEISKWEFPNAIKFYGDLEKFKLGNLITEISRTENSDENVATAMIDRETGCLGVMNNMKFRTYADEYFNVNNETPEVYSLTYYHKTTPNSFNKQVSGSSSSSNTDAYLKTKFNSSYKNLTSSSPRATAPEIFVLDYMSGLKDEWITATTTQTSGVVKMGYAPAFSFDNVKILIASTTDTHTDIPSPILTPETGYSVNAYGSCTFDKESITVTPSIAENNFENTEIFYYITQDNTPVYDKSNLTKADGSITIDSDCIIYAYTVLTTDGIEHVSQPAMMRFTKVAPILIDFYDDLLNPDNNGKVVRLNFVTKNIAAGQIYIPSATTPGLEKKSVAQLIDSGGNPIKIECLTPSTDNTWPMPAFITQTTSNSYNTWATSSFINKGWLVGKLNIIDGHPIITIVDMVGTEQFNYKSYNSTSSALTAADAGVILADFQQCLSVSEIKPEHWGKRIILTNLSGYNAIEFTAKQENGEDIELAWGTNTKNISNHWTGTLNPEENDLFAVHGIVDYDAVSAKYFVRVLGFNYKPLKPKIASVDDLESVTPSDDIDVTFEGLLKSGTLILKANRVGEDSKLSTVYYYVYDYNDPNHKQLGNAFSVSNTGVTNITLTNYKPTFVDGIAKLAVVSSTSNKTYDGTGAIANSDTLFVSLHDYLSAAEVFTSITDFANAFANRDESELTENCYVKIESKENPGEFVITNYNKNNIAIRDTSDLIGKNVIILHVSTEDGFEEKSGNAFLFKENYKTSKTSSTFSRQLRAGDALRSFTGKAKFVDGNWIIDVTGLNAIFYGGGGNTIFLSSSDDSYYSDLIGNNALTEKYIEPEKAVITTDYINRLIILQGISIAIDDKSIATSDEIGSVAQTNETFYGVTASPLPLSWNFMTSSADADIHKSLIKNAEPDEKFTVQGIIMSDGSDGVKLEVIDLNIAHKMLYVCNHEEHDTYSMNQEFTENYSNKLVGVAGVKIKRQGEDSDAIYELLIKTPVKLNWTDDKQTQKSADIAIITNNIPTNEDITSIEFEITGFLRIADDGSQSIDVIELTTQNKTMGNFKLYANSESTVNTFSSFSVPNISAITAGGIPTSGAENYRFFYRLAPAPYAEVKTRLDAGEELEQIKNEYLKDVPEKLFNPETFEAQTESYFIDAYSCTPGRINPIISQYYYIEKVSKNVTSLEDVVNGNYSYKHLTTPTLTSPDVYFFEKPLRVVGVNAEYGYLAVTDGSKVIGLRLMRSISEKIVAGDYLSPLAIQRKWHNHFYNLLKSDFSSLKLESAPEYTVEIPEAVTMTENLADHKGQLVKIVTAKVSHGSNLVNKPVALDDNSISALVTDEEWVMTTTISGNDVVLPITSHLGWTPEGITADNDDEFIVKGIIMPRTTLTDPNKQPEYNGNGDIVEVKANDSQFELWATSVEVRRRTAAPVITLSGEESNEDGVAVATETVTATITCEDGATIEYSLDGETWLPYTAPLTINKSEEISARAVLGDYRESRVVTQTVRFEYISGDVRITVSDPMPGYTEVRMAPVDATLADGTYTIRYTTDGSEPTATSAAYTAPLELEAATTVKAALFETAKDRQGKTTQQIVNSIKSGNVKVAIVNDDNGTHVVLSPESNRHLASGFDIFYAFEGGDGEWTRYSAFIHIEENCKIMVYMVEHGKTDGNIVKVDITGIAGIAADDAASVSVEGDSIIAPEGSQVFDMTGRQVRREALRPGIYIVRLPGGKAVKVAVK